MPKAARRPNPRSPRLPLAVRRRRWRASLAGGAVLLAACVSQAPAPIQLPSGAPPPGAERPVDAPRIVRHGAPLQCVPFARDISGIQIRGDAHTWWAQAAGRYPRGNRPAAGAVLSLHSYAGPDRGHLAVVARVVNDRLIIVDHANWHNSGEVTLSAPVRDESDANDWTLVRIWNAERGEWGARLTPAHGFIGPAQSLGPISARLRRLG
jgi:hypothetical protein